jgi:hypothetical protein
MMVEFRAHWKAVDAEVADDITLCKWAVCMSRRCVESVMDKPLGDGDVQPRSDSALPTCSRLNKARRFGLRRPPRIASSALSDGVRLYKKSCLMLFLRIGMPEINKCR